MIAAQLPDGAALGRTIGAPDWATKLARDTPGVDHAIAISGMSALDNFADLANAGVAFVVLKPWDERGKKTHTTLLSIAGHLQAALDAAPDGKLFVAPPPAIQGIGNAGGLQMQPNCWAAASTMRSSTRSPASSSRKPPWTRSCSAS